MKDIFEEIFNNDNCPEIICNNDGSLCWLNLQAKNLFNLETVSNIKDIFPELELKNDSSQFTVKDKRARTHSINCIHLYENNKCLLRVDVDDLSDWKQFVEDQKILHHMYLDLCLCESEEDIYKKVVEDGLKKLKLDRIGVLLISIKENLMLGSWGTDEMGNVVDQSNFRSSFEHDEWVLDSLKRRDFVAVNYSVNLRNENDVIGQGWNTISAFFDNDEPIGWIACDNFFTHKPLAPWKKEIIGELGRIVGQLVSRFRQESRLQELVKERTKELRLSQKSLIETEKMASLGALVAGVSHEINTPLGIALTAASFFTDRTEQIKEKVNNNELKKNELLDYLSDIFHSGNMTLESLNRASNLVGNFKKLAVDQSIEKKQDFFLYDLIKTISNTSKQEFKDKEFQLINNIDKKLSLFSFLGDFIQIFSNLIKNSIIHGFEDTENGQIEISSDFEGKSFNLTYSDNGIGIIEKDLKHAFEPFFTTKRHTGVSGLGLSLVYNLVLKLGGTIEITNKNPGLLILMKFNTRMHIFKD